MALEDVKAPTRYQLCQMLGGLNYGPVVVLEAPVLDHEIDELERNIRLSLEGNRYNKTEMRSTRNHIVQRCLEDLCDYIAWRKEASA